MFQFPNYTLTEKISEDSKNFVYRGYHYPDHQPVLIKILKERYPSIQQIARLHYEQDITKDLNLKNVIRIYDLQKYDHTYAMIFEDIQGEALSTILATHQLDLVTSLRIALQVTEALEELHAHHIIHKNINPDSIIVNLETGETKLTDLSFASKGFALIQASVNLSHLSEKQVMYISPEQTGRMNRDLDYRTDFYSLGAVLYEMFMGCPPFQSSERIELVHCHLAKQPEVPHLVIPFFPKVLSQIILKLLEKTAEARYQSAYGLKMDLTTCLNQLQIKRNIEEFTCGLRDVNDKFSIPQKLYGRETEIHHLLQSFKYVCQGHRHILLITGYSGMGKTSIVQEIYQPVTQRRGYFISGKFDQYQRNVPYLAVVKALKTLVQQLLTENETSLQQWRTELLQALGNQGQVITQVIPDVELIIGKQASVPILIPTEAQARFNQVFQNFIRVFCQQEHPLVIFLDDLQWIDAASLQLIELIMANDQMPYLFLIGAYRDNEVNVGHPLLQTLEKLKKYHVIHQMTLTPLTLQHVRQLIAETLSSDESGVEPLAGLVMSKTQGNPFFVNQFLRMLHDEGLIKFLLPSERSSNSQKILWQWDINKIHEKDITDNVVELMVGKLKKLPSLTQHILQLAACLGSRFDLRTLAIIYQKSPLETFKDLLPALREDLLVFPTSELEASYEAEPMPRLVIHHYKFLHDRVQQAAYALIDPSHQEELHYHIGKLLFAQVPQQERNERIFEFIDHLNRGQALIKTVDGRVQWVELNLLAVKKAKASMAYRAALYYVLHVFSSLQRAHMLELFWEKYYHLAVELYTERATVEYLNNHFEDSEQIIWEAYRRVKTPLEKAEMLHMLIMQYTLSARYEEAIETGRQALALVDIDLPKNHLQEVLHEGMEQVKNKLKDRPIASLFDLPEMVHPEQKMAVKLLVTMGPPCYRSHQRLWAVVVTQIIDLVIEYGNVPQIGYSHTAYGGLLAYVWQDYKSAIEFGDLAARLMTEKFTHPSDQSVFYLMIGSSVRHWSKHLKYATEDYQKAYQIGLQSGNLQYAAYAFGHNMYCRFYQGIPLEELLREIKDALAFSKTRRNQWAVDLLDGGERVVEELLTGDFCKPLSAEKLYLARCKENKNIQVICIYAVMKTWKFYLQGCFKEALESLHQAEELFITVATQGLFPSVAHRFNESLLYLALHAQASVQEQTEYWKKIHANQELAKTLAHQCPENFLHQYLLIAAEIAAHSGNDVQAMDLYDQAITAAMDNNFTHHVALANELAAQFWLRKGKAKIAQSYLQEAYYNYRLWGAQCKVFLLENQYPGLSTLLSSEEVAAPLDMETFIKAAQALSSEIVLDALINKLLHIAVENAGAQGGVLILAKQGQFWLEAEISTHPNAQLSPKSVITHALPLDAIGEEMGNVLVPVTIIHYVIRTERAMVLDDARNEDQFAQDPYMIERQPKSVFCMPMIYQGQVVGVLYLENNLISKAFTEERVSVLKLLSTHIAISLQNALLYSQREQAHQIADTANRAKSAFLANMSHELRTPLNCILGFTQLFSQSQKLTSQQSEWIEIIQRNGNHLLTLLNDVLELSKLETGQLDIEIVEFYLDSFLSSLVDMFTWKAKQKKISFNYFYISDLPKLIKTDQKRLRQILVNLLGNAMKFTERGGITLKIGYEEDFELVRIHGKLPQTKEPHPKSKIRFQIEDTGIGIDHKELEKIFLPFQRIEKSKNSSVSSGVGLGLAMTKRLVEAMGGELHVKSRLEQGSIFWVTFEFSKASKSTLVQSGSEYQIIVGFQREDRENTCKIMVIDDNRENCLFMSNILRPLGFEVIEAYEGEQGIEKAQRFQPDLIAIDLVMIPMDGFEAIRQLSKIPTLKNVPIIAMSTSPLNSSIQHSHDFILKPIDTKVLLACLEKHLNLTWCYQENSSQQNSSQFQKTGQVSSHEDFSAIKFPLEQATLLKELAVTGDIARLLEYIEELKHLDLKLLPLVNKVKELANDFEMEEISQLVEKHSEH